MKNLFRIIGFTSLAIIIGFGITACPGETGTGTGTKSGNWVDGFYEPAEPFPPMMWQSVDGISFFGNHVDDRVWDIAAGNGKYVAVGGWWHNGTKAIAHTANPEQWQPANGNFAAEIRSVAYGGGRFVAGDVGDFRTNAPADHPDNYVSGKTYYSTDGGVNWTGPIDTKLRSIIGLVYGNGKWLALSLDGRMAVSENGAQNWTELTQKFVYDPDEAWWLTPTSTTILPKGNNSALRGGIFVNGTWIIVGMRGLTAWSTDLETWNVVPIDGFDPSNSIQKIIYAQNKLFVVGDVGKMFYSEDLGKTWTIITGHGYGAADIYNIDYGNGFFVTVGSGGRVVCSEDGMLWFPLENDFLGAQSVYGLVYRGGWWIAGARSGVIAVSNVHQ